MIDENKNGPQPIFHITPLNDTYPHDLNASGECWCCPERDYDYFDPTYVHHAYDRREEYENGWRKPH